MSDITRKSSTSNDIRRLNSLGLFAMQGDMNRQEPPLVLALAFAIAAACSGSAPVADSIERQTPAAVNADTTLPRLPAPADPAPTAVLDDTECSHITRIPVQSSAMRSVGYCADRSVLEIEFQRGTVYRYAGVPENVYQSLMSAPSKGRYLNSVIKPTGYSYERVR